MSSKMIVGLCQCRKTAFKHVTVDTTKHFIIPIWLQQVEENVGLSVGAAWIAGQDRSMWRTLRPSAGQAQQ